MYYDALAENSQLVSYPYPPQERSVDKKQRETNGKIFSIGLTVFCDTKGLNYCLSMPATTVGSSPPSGASTPMMFVKYSFTLLRGLKTASWRILGVVRIGIAEVKYTYE
ncbi:hypothetical protein PIIN_07501 [Serendipita indica DSM 11827]|uniref:Uncharacterized protein n=1 Tax=Serendipita indica (strain DSM 11827) TaxID=1109443 RepID=G4TQF5_SERID|nr:hypothetical protein PIIN_07501 [Serendipita indica DSM 11827]